MELLYLFGAHFLYDFSWQGEFVGKYKSKSIFILLVHSFTWAAILTLVLAICGVKNFEVFAFLFVSHAIIDKWKCRSLIGEDKHDKWCLYMDQALHALTLLIVWYFLF